MYKVWYIYGKCTELILHFAAFDISDSNVTVEIGLRFFLLLILPAQFETLFSLEGLIEG